MQARAILVVPLVPGFAVLDPGQELVHCALTLGVKVLVNFLLQL